MFGEPLAVTLRSKLPPVQIDPTTGGAEIVISGVTVTVTGLEYTSSHPLSFAYTYIRYSVVAVNTPVLYVGNVAPGIAFHVPLNTSH